jgi:type I restriction enzyme, S subunit
MSNSYPPIKLGEIVREEHEPIGVFDGAGLPVLGVTNIEGVTQTGVKASDDRSKYLRLRPRRFVYNPYRINVGSLGLSSDTQDGICSPAYVVFAPTERVNAKFLLFFLKSARGSQLINFHGNRGSVRSALRFHDLCQIEIPLPPLEDQRRIVTRIEELSAKIEQVRLLRKHVGDEAAAIMGSELGAKFAALAESFPVKALGELASHILDGPHITPHYLSEGVPGIPFVTVKNMVTGTLNFDDLNYISEDDHRVFTKRCKAERGDVLYSKDGATRGRPCFVDTDREFSFFVSVALIKPMRERLDGRYLAYLLNSNWIKDRMSNRSRGDMIPHIVLREIRAFPVPVPSLIEQRTIVAHLDKLQKKLESLKSMQTEGSRELDALLPSILDKAFRGEL